MAWRWEEGAVWENGVEEEPHMTKRVLADEPVEERVDERGIHRRRRRQ